MKKYLSIDQGTSSSRAIIFDANLNLINDSQQEYDLAYPNDGWVELNPNDVLETVRDTVVNVRSEVSITGCKSSCGLRPTTDLDTLKCEVPLSV